MTPTYISEDDVQRRLKAAREQGFENGVEEMASRQDNEWHLDKKVPLVFMAAIFVQTLTFVFFGTAWKTNIDARVEILEKSDSERRPQEVRLVKVEERLFGIEKVLGRIEVKLESQPLRR